MGISGGEVMIGSVNGTITNNELSVFAMNSAKNKEDNAFVEMIKAKESSVPYGMLDRGGYVEYNGVHFVCDYQNNALCLGDMSEGQDIVSVPLEKGGSLKFNWDNLNELAQAIDMFSPKDINNILRAIAQHTQKKKIEAELDNEKNMVPATSTNVKIKQVAIESTIQETNEQSQTDKRIDSLKQEFDVTGWFVDRK